MKHKQDSSVQCKPKSHFVFVTRYVSTSSNDVSIKEVLLKMIECSKGVSGEALSKSILEAVEELRLDMDNCRGQGYDGAGNFSHGE